MSPPFLRLTSLIYFFITGTFVPAIPTPRRHGGPNQQVYDQHSPVALTPAGRRRPAVPAQVADQTAEDDLPLQVWRVRHPGGSVH